MVTQVPLGCQAVRAVTNGICVVKAQKGRPCSPTDHQLPGLYFCAAFPRLVICPAQYDAGVCSRQLWPGHLSAANSKDAAEDEQFVMFNQDLVGFVPSIPAPRIMQACEWLVTRYQQLHAVNTAIVFTVSLAEKQVQVRVFRGRARATGQHQVSIDLVDVLPLCHLSLQAGLFVHLGRVLKQVRGAAIGNQVSPVLANIAVSILEQAWATAAKVILDEQRHTFFCVRYVDNRLVLVSTRLL